MKLSTKFRRRIFRLQYHKVTCARLGFEECEAAVSARVDEYFSNFLDGYHLALDEQSLEALSARLNLEVSPEFLGFAYEGAGMYLALRDFLTPWKKSRVSAFIEGPARAYMFVSAIGIGFIFPRLPWTRWRVKHYVERLSPELCWLAVDGYGFHQGLFHHRRYVERCERPRGLPGRAARYFDNGVGRSIWFVKGASPGRIDSAIRRFGESRRADLWAGVGLACAFAGGVVEDFNRYEAVLLELKKYGREYRRHVGLGVMLAAAARLCGEIDSPWTSRACQLILGVTFSEAGRQALRIMEEVMRTLENSPAEEIRLNAYEMTRRRIMEYVDERAQAVTA